VLRYRQGAPPPRADARAARRRRRHARAAGAPAVEGYPFDRQPGTGSGDLYPGTLRAFLDAGFAEVSRPLPRRAVVRLDLA
jgi:hypothetical protein